ncbi:hypothetical protein DAEQUDRAFT_666500 [Daedalea quercina L-15889]|uniref:Xylanolytic transcriptional activator regulatory domain-containing protein n=1 Tax=Daedalea quercina L-15889 TaxID=1314783 RepID=A0A165RRM1_9APHY|nr:hypothetical protein DAEQUDRAFT_666500 [Daedalea quercina L-15889]
MQDELINVQRCDGARPTCQQCVRANTPTECVYGQDAEESGIQLLEERISRLQGRIAFLESNTAGPILLHDPYAQTREDQPPRPVRPAARERQILMRSFSGGASQVGFFLHVPRFLQRMSALSLSTAPKHASTLINAVYLLGAYFSTDPNLQNLQSDLLADTLQDLSAALIELNPPAIIDVLQAEILLTYYFFSNSRTVEGVYHIDAASAIVLASKLHQIRSGRYSAVAGGHASRYDLAPPVDAIEEGQRINAFWVVFILDRNWSKALGRTPVLTDDESKGTGIDTPWPRSIETYESNPLPEGFRGFRTVQRFLYYPIFMNEEQNPLATHAKAAVLYSSAARVAAQTGMMANTLPPFWLALDDRIAQFEQVLPPVDRINPSRQDLHNKILLVNLLVHGAVIELHQPLEIQGPVFVSNSRSTRAALAAVNILTRINVERLSHVDPIVGFLLASVVQILMRALASSRQNTAATGSQQQIDILMALARIRSALGAWGVRNAYICACVLSFVTSQTDVDLLHADSQYTVIASLLEGI